MARQRPSASHHVAWASQPVLRVRGWPRCRAAPAVRRWRAASPRQRDLAGEQVGFDRTRGVQLVQPRGHPPGRLQQCRRTVLTLGEPAEQQGQFGAGRPPRTLLAAEQPQGFGTALLREAEITGREGCDGGGVQQLGAPGRRTMILLDPGHRRIDLAQGFSGQAGRQQHCALVDEQVSQEDVKPAEQGLGMIEVGEGGGEVAPDVRGQPALQAGERVVCSLAALEPQRLDPGVVPVGPRDIAHGEVYRCSVVQRTRRPDQVTCAGQQAHGGLGVPQRLGVAAQEVKGADPADQDPAREDAATAALHQGVQDRQATPGLAGQHQGHAQAGRDIRLPVRVPGLAREPARDLELRDRLADVAEVPEDHAGRLVRDRRLRRRGAPGQHLAGGGESFRRPRQRQGQQLVGLPGHWGAVRNDRHL